MVIEHSIHSEFEDSASLELFRSHKNILVTMYWLTWCDQLNKHNERHHPGIEQGWTTGPK